MSFDKCLYVGNPKPYQDKEYYGHLRKFPPAPYQLISTP